MEVCLASSCSLFWVTNVVPLELVKLDGCCSSFLNYTWLYSWSFSLVWLKFVTEFSDYGRALQDLLMKRFNWSSM